MTVFNLSSSPEFQNILSQIKSDIQTKVHKPLRLVKSDAVYPGWNLNRFEYFLMDNNSLKSTVKEASYPCSLCNGEITSVSYQLSQLDDSEIEVAIFINFDEDLLNEDNFNIVDSDFNRLL